MTSDSVTLNDTAANDTAAREIVITRLFNAPRELVFQAWTNPKHVAQWWGPRVFTIPVCEMDVRPGGVWRYVMRGPDGSDYPVNNRYLEVVPPERLVYSARVEAPESAIWGGSPPPDSINTLTFEAHEGQTKLTISTLLETVEARNAMAQKGYVEGMTEGLVRLEELLAASSA